ncbi:radical SAM protein [Pseudobutyrivibrio sp.]|uniref:radical SAM protein n=1 Tax=Pseudobutyrivibrio sp. TaxID=2014367 RepID=UPI0025ED1774|nr:radical SAM protein [Pseudobutyrivibrio sp.]
MGRIRNIIKGYIPDRVWQVMRIIFNPKKPKKKLRVEIHVVDHCNLNCKGCDNFSCLAEVNYLSIDSYIKDLERLQYIFGDDVEWITMMGGEPLLNKDIIIYCSIARKLFPNALVRIITNGTLLLKQDDAFWDGLKKNNVLLYVTKYPIPYDYDGAKAYAEEKGVKFEYAFESGDVLKTMYMTPIDIRGGQNPRLSYQLCGKGNKCITLKDGKLYTCETIPNFFTFNNFFGTDIKITENDYIDIYKCDDPKVIMKKMATFVPACRYCDNIHYCSGIEWGVTEKKITEWVRE